MCEKFAVINLYFCQEHKKRMNMVIYSTKQIIYIVQYNKQEIQLIDGLLEEGENAYKLLEKLCCENIDI